MGEPSYRVRAVCRRRVTVATETRARGVTHPSRRDPRPRRGARRRCSRWTMVTEGMWTPCRRVTQRCSASSRCACPPPSVRSPHPRRRTPGPPDLGTLPATMPTPLVLLAWERRDRRGRARHPHRRGGPGASLPPPAGAPRPRRAQLAAVRGGHRRRVPVARIPGA